MNLTNVTQFVYEGLKVSNDIDLMRINKEVTQAFWDKNLIFLVVSMVFVWYMYLRLRFYFRTVVNHGLEVILNWIDSFLSFIIITWGIVVFYTLGYERWLFLGIAFFCVPIIIMDIPWYRRKFYDYVETIKEFLKKAGRE